jgi:hypothetical protein
LSDGLWLKFKQKIHITKKDEDADNCADKTSFQQHTHKYHRTNNTYSLFYYVFVKHYTSRQEFFGEIQGEISKTKRELYS